MKQIFVIDPGMMEAGGHHAALLSTLVSYNDVQQYSITSVTHYKLADTLLSQAENKGLRVEKHFHSNFYENYESSDSLKSTSTQRYIRQLSAEYVACFQSVQNNTQHTSDITCFYPCLNWDHAFALNLALAYCQKNGLLQLEQCQHKVCCMFTPAHHNGALKSLAYKQAFTALAVKKGVKLFASDYETRQFYEQLAIPISDIHPCYLLPWEQTDTTKIAKYDVPNILLFLGDAKENKGFNRLPTLINELLTQYSYNVVITVQYTLAWDYPELRESIKALDKLNKEYEQVLLYKEYWSADKLAQQLQSIDAIYCTYSADEYKNKSSGLAWLARFFGIPVVLYGECWLTREFRRLNHEYSVIGENHYSTVDRSSVKKAQTYFRGLFSNLLHWLEH